VSFAAEEGYLDLTNVDGKTVRAKVLKYDDATDMALIEGDNHKRYTIKADVFCDKDRNIIRNWESLRTYINDSALSVSVERVALQEDGKERRQKLENGREQLYSMSAACYKVSLENHTERALGNLIVEINTFVILDVLNPEQEFDFSIKFERPMENCEIDTIDTNDEMSFSTRPEGWESLIEQKGSKVTTKNIIELQGVWVRIYTTLPDGTAVLVREVRNPYDLWTGIHWSDASKAIDLKDGNRVIDEELYLNELGFPVF